MDSFNFNDSLVWALVIWIILLLLTLVAVVSAALFALKKTKKRAVAAHAPDAVLLQETSDDRELMKGIIQFGTISVVEIMTSRVDMTDVSEDGSFAELMAVVTTHGYSRIPVYAGSHDNVRGVLYVKDLLPHLSAGDDFQWQTLIRPAYFVPESKKIDDLMREFQKDKIHLAFVIDEFGSVSGIVTMEDILEEIVGEISDEHDVEKQQYVRLSPNTFIFEGKILLNDFFKVKDIKEEDFADLPLDAETLAGMVLELKGEIPEKKEKIKYGKYTFEILEANDRKIEKIKLYF